MSSAKFRTGHVLHQAGAASWSNAASWIALAALVQSPMIVLVASGLSRQMRSHWALAALSAAITGAFLIIGQAAVTDAMVVHLRGRRARLAELASMALHLPAPLIRLAVAYGAVCGLLTLVPPPIRVYAFWGFVIVAYFFCSVAVPVIVIEQAGAIQALRRTVSLTSRHGSELAGIHLLLLMPLLMILGLVSQGVNAIASPAERGLVLQVVITLMMALSAGVVGTSLYRELRLVREGVDLERIPSTPDARVHR